MRMKKRVISMLLAISMIASLVCVPTFAEGVTDSGGHDHVIFGVQSGDQEQGALDEGQEGGAGSGESVAPSITSTDEDDTSSGEPEEIVYTTCIHGKTMGETCELCGELAHSSKNIPLIGYDQEFFDQVNPDEDEGWLLYTIRLVCPHGTADGVYCEKCGHVVDNDPADLPMCTILDCCLHGHVKGEKCEACQELKEEQGDYELAEGEAWDDPLIYATDLMAFDSNVADMNGSGMLHCSWCGTALGDGINVGCHWDSSKGQYHWCTISRVEASGTCESHYVTWVYKCGVRISTNNSPYPCHHTGNCTWNTYKNWHNTILSAATCQSEGRLQKYYTNSCIHCGAESPAQSMTTELVPKLSHIITGCAYIDSSTHQVECSGNGTDPHNSTESHNFKKNGEDYICEGCGAVKTTVHVDAYTTDGELCKSDLVTDIVDVSPDEPGTVSIATYQTSAIAASRFYGFIPNDEQSDTAEIRAGGVRLKLYGHLDEIAPTLTAVLDRNTITIKAYDDVSGLKEIKYLGQTFSADAPIQFIGEGNAKQIEYSATGVADGIYQITAMDYAGNISSCNIIIGDGSGAPDADNFSMWVPSSIAFHVSKDGGVTYTPGDPKIYNGSEIRPITVRSIFVTPVADWSLVDYASDFGRFEIDDSYIGLSINGTPVSANGFMKLNPEDWTIAADGTLALDFDIKVPKQSEARILPDVLRVNFTGDWANNDPESGVRYMITVIPNKHASVANNVVAYYTDSTGKITMLPAVVPETGYAFNGWINAETGDAATVGQVLTGDISVTPDIQKIQMVTVSFEAGYNGTISDVDPVTIEAGKTFADLKSQVTLPTTTPYMAVFSGWTLNGEKLTNTSVISEDCVLVAKFSSYFAHEGGTVTGVSDAYKTLPSKPATVTIPDTIDGSTITTIGESAFDYWANNKVSTGIKNLSLPSTLTRVENRAFASDLNLTITAIPSSVTYIGPFGFSGVSLTDSTLPAGLTYLGERGFYRTQFSNWITIPAGITELFGYTFASARLYGVTFAGSTEKIDENVFWDSTLNTIVLPDTLKEIGVNAFYKTKLTSLVVPDSVEVLASMAICGTPTLKRLTIGKGITDYSITDIQNLESLEELTIRGAATGLNSSTFYACRKITDVYINKNAEQFRPGDIFTWCNPVPTIHKITVD